MVNFKKSGLIRVPPIQRNRRANSYPPTALQRKQNRMPRTIDEVMADLPPAQQEEIERRYQALRRTLPLSQRDKAPDDVLRPKA
jgi:hypothetical protein